MSKYNEILILHTMLTEAGIPHEITPFLGGYQIGYPSQKDVVCSVIEHDGSYGRDCDLLEIMGLLTAEEEECDSVLGYLTAIEVFRRIFKDSQRRGLTDPTKCAIIKL